MLGLTLSVNAQTKHLDSLRQVQQQALERYRSRMHQEQEEYSARVQKQYEAYRQAEAKARQEFREQIARTWGDRVALSNRKTWVEYSEDQTARSVVDFETGTARVELVIPEGVGVQAPEVRKKAEQVLTGLVLTRGTTKDYDTPYESRQSLSETPVLAGQVRTDDGLPVGTGNVAEFAAKTVGKQSPKVETIIGKDGIKRKMIEYSFPLVSNYMVIRAAGVKKEVEYFCTRYEVAPALVYAIIHTESAFNPKARSYVPAFGLMQIVPRYAGKDASRFVYGEEKLLTENYLYDVRNNIEMGVAYLHILLTRSFRGVTVNDNRLLCSIAAYNTGVGNVCRAFTGNRNPKEAIPLINQYEFGPLFDHLSRHLPAEETRQYIRKVTQRMLRYQELIEHQEL